MTLDTTVTPGLETHSPGSLDAEIRFKEQSQDDPFPYAWRGGWDGSEMEPLASWAQFNWLCTSVLGGPSEMPFLVAERTDATERAAQVFGESGGCTVEVQASRRMQRVCRPGAKGEQRMLTGADGTEMQVFTSEVFDRREAALIARIWLESGVLVGLKRRRIRYCNCKSQCWCRARS